MKKFCQITAHKVKAAIDPEEALALSIFHGLNGSDEVSAFAYHGKRATWAAMGIFSQISG